MAYLDQATTLREAVFMALGAASTCWDNPEGAGVFHSDRCQEIGDELMERIERLRAAAKELLDADAQLVMADCKDLPQARAAVVHAKVVLREVLNKEET